MLVLVFDWLMRIGNVFGKFNEELQEIALVVPSFFAHVEDTCFATRVDGFSRGTKYNRRVQGYAPLERSKFSET